MKSQRGILKAQCSLLTPTTSITARKKVFHTAATSRGTRETSEVLTTTGIRRCLSLELPVIGKKPVPRLPAQQQPRPHLVLAIKTFITDGLWENDYLRNTKEEARGIPK